MKTKWGRASEKDLVGGLVEIKLASGAILTGTSERGGGGRH